MPVYLRKSGGRTVFLGENVVGFFNSLFSNKRYYVPYGMTPQKRAQELLEDAKYHADEINRSTDVFDFSYSYTKLEEITSELIWLNEKKKVFMYPSPAEDWEKIQDNMENTINDFIDRAVNSISSSNFDKDIPKMLKDLFDEIKSDDTMSVLINQANIDKMNRIIQKEVEKMNFSIEKITLGLLGFKSNIDVSKINPMKVIIALEQNISNLYTSFYMGALSAERGSEIFSSFKNACLSSKLPLMAEVRLESLFAEYETKFNAPNPISLADQMSGTEFEQWCASLLSKNGFENIQITPGSRDQGVDIVAEKEGVHYAIQCKCYASDLGNKPVQEVYAGKEMYGCQVGAVMTNRYFTSGAKQLAEKTRVLLWDRDKLINMVDAQ